MIHAFMFEDRYIVLDVESGAVHEVDQLVYDIARIWETEGEQAIVDRLSVRYPIEEIHEALGELQELKERGDFDTPENAFTPFSGPPVVKALCLHVAHDCNLRCSYCFAKTGEYHLGRAMMPLQVGKQALDFLMVHSGQRKHLEVDFFGGEPLMNFGVIKGLVVYGRKLEKKFDKKIDFTLTTNCLAINEEVKEFCRREIHNVVLSVDGRREVHDATRRMVCGKPSYDAILPKAKELGLSRQKEGLDYYIRGTFTRRNMDFSNDVLALADEGFEQISIEPVVMDSSSPLALKDSDLPEIFDEYDRLVHKIFEREKSGKWLNFFHFMVDLENGPCLSKRMSGCGAGGEYVAVTPQGDIYPCHQFVGKTEYRMGSVITGEFNSVMQEKFRACNVTTKQTCRKCWAKYYCSGGCAVNAANFNGSIDKPYEFACKLERKRLECAIGMYIHDKELGKQNEYDMIAE